MRIPMHMDDLHGCKSVVRGQEVRNDCAGAAKSMDGRERPLSAMAPASPIAPTFGALPPASMQSSPPK